MSEEYTQNMFSTCIFMRNSKLQEISWYLVNISYNKKLWKRMVKLTHGTNV